MQIDHIAKTIKNSPVRLLDAFVDRVFEFVDQPLLPSQVPLGALVPFIAPACMHAATGNGSGRSGIILNPYSQVCVGFFPCINQL